MKTIVYIDGYNLYYSLIRGTPYKWLNLYSLFNDKIVLPQTPNATLNCIKYYTSDIKAKFASHGTTSQQSQQRYHRALESTGKIDIIKGTHIVTRSTPMRYKKPPDKKARVEVWSIEEKQTDVNLALDIYRDTVLKTVDQIILCSNDTDIVGALKYVRSDFPHITIGLVSPFRKNHHDRIAAKTLIDHADWVRHYITDEELEYALFKNRVPTPKKPVIKPNYW